MGGITMAKKVSNDSKVILQDSVKDLNGEVEYLQAQISGLTKLLIIAEKSVEAALSKKTDIQRSITNLENHKKEKTEKVKNIKLDYK